MIGTKEREIAPPPTDPGGNGNHNYTGPGRETLEGGDDGFRREFESIIKNEFPERRVRGFLGREAIRGLAVLPDRTGNNQQRHLPSGIFTGSFKVSARYTNYPIN